MPGLKMNLNCPRRLAVYAVFDVLDTMGAEYARSMVGDIQAKVKVLGKTSGYAFAVTEQSPDTSILHAAAPSGARAYGGGQTACLAISDGQHPASYGSGPLPGTATLRWARQLGKAAEYRPWPVGKGTAMLRKWR